MNLSMKKVQLLLRQILKEAIDCIEFMNQLKNKKKILIILVIIIMMKLMKVKLVKIAQNQ